MTTYRVRYDDDHDRTVSAAGLATFEEAVAVARLGYDFDRHAIETEEGVVVAHVVGRSVTLV